MADHNVVGVNLLWLVPGVVGGSEEYILRLLRALDRLDPDDLWIKLYARPELLKAHPDLNERFEMVVTPSTLGGKVGRVAGENTWLASACREDDLMHHAGGVVPLVTSTPSVLTIHDLQPLEMPDHFGIVKRTWLTAMLPRSVKQAELILCPSQFTANSVAEMLNIDTDRLRVVPHGHERTKVGVIDDEMHQRNIDRFGRFALLPAIAYPHKRHIDLIEALDQLRDRFPDLSVVMTGGEGPETERLRERIAELGLDDRCHLLGRVSEEEIDSLFRSAFVMAFPSTYEGFGNPTLEAMARGCPVVATTAASIPEVVGDAGLLVEPARPRALAAAIARVLDDEKLADSLREAGVERAKAFGWRQAAESLVSAYRGALS